MEAEARPLQLAVIHNAACNADIMLTPCAWLFAERLPSNV